MAFAGGFRGVSAAQDARFSDKQQKLLKTMKFSKELLKSQVDMSRVNWSVMRGWIARKTEELLGFEDEVLNGYIAEQLEGQEVNWGEWGKKGKREEEHRASESVSFPFVILPLTSFLEFPLSQNKKTHSPSTRASSRSTSRPSSRPRLQNS